MWSRLIIAVESCLDLLRQLKEFSDLSDDGIKTKIVRKCDKFFRKMTFKGVALSYNDVRLRTCYSEILPRDVVLRTRFSTNVWLNMPIVSSPMGNITESAMAIAMAKSGGLGIIHKNLSPEDQAAEVKKVKHCLSAFLDEPVCVNPEDTVEKIYELRKREGIEFWSFPVVSDSKLIGLVT